MIKGAFQMARHCRASLRGFARKRRMILCLFLLTVLGAQVFATERVACNAVKSKTLLTSVGYCALLPPGYDAHPSKKFPVLYFLHGLGADQSFMVTSGGWNLIADAFEQKRLGEFVIITPQAGNSFYINSKNGFTKYEDFFIREFIPQMEKRFRIVNTRSGRAIGGVSMGGYGALRFAFKYPQMFVAVAAHMPALLEQLPRGAAKTGLSGILGPGFGNPADEVFWKANTPFAYARAANLNGLTIYFDCGDHDDFGFDAGTRDLDQLLTTRKVAHTAHIYPGQHDAIFLEQHLIESMAVVSRAFGLTK
jgi:S-formylglutathione hydrolase FrmB